jgi:hypothetical protein
VIRAGQRLRKLVPVAGRSSTVLGQRRRISASSALGTPSRSVRSGTGCCVVDLVHQRRPGGRVERRAAR